MNKIQKLLLILTLALLVGMGLYPPWIRTDAFGMTRHRGYSFALHPPASVADSLLASAPVRYSVDWDHLAMAWFGVVAVALTLVIVLRTRGGK